MRIEREYEKRDIRESFFPVAEVPLKYVWGGEEHDVRGYKGIVDVERRQVLSTVSKRYTLVRNEEVYELLRPVAQEFFGGSGLDDFECLNILMPQSRASCRIDLTRKNPESHLFKVCGGDPWTAFVRIANSYNRTSKLEIQIGYCRWICQNGIIFGARSYSVALRHDVYALSSPAFRESVIRGAIRAVGDAGGAEKEFAASLETLRALTMTEEETEMLFWRVFGFRSSPNGLKALPKQRRDGLLGIRERMQWAMASYRREFGGTAYAAFNVLTDFASFPDGDRSHAFLTPIRQAKVGDWLAGFVPAAREPGFAFDRYFTQDDTVPLNQFRNWDRLCSQGV
jgi:hypothetical protein